MTHICEKPKREREREKEGEKTEAQKVYFSNDRKRRYAQVHEQNKNSKMHYSKNVESLY